MYHHILCLFRYVPENNTLLSIEGDSNKITRITKTSIAVEEKVKTIHPSYSLHQGTFDNMVVSVHVMGISSYGYNAVKNKLLKSQDKVVFREL